MLAAKHAELPRLAEALLLEGCPWVEGLSLDQVCGLMASSGVVYYARHISDGGGYDGPVWVWPNVNNPAEVAYWQLDAVGEMCCAVGSLGAYLPGDWAYHAPVALDRHLRAVSREEATQLASRVFLGKDDTFDRMQAPQIADALLTRGLVRFEVDRTHFYLFLWSSGPQLIGACMPSASGYVALAGPVGSS